MSISYALRPGRIVMAAITCIGFGAIHTSADIRFWDGSIGDWDTDASWTGGIEPDSTDEVFILSGDVDVTQPLEFAGDLTLDTATLDVQAGSLLYVTFDTKVAAGGTFNLNGGTFSFDGNTIIKGGDFIRNAGTFVQGAGATLTVEDGGLFEWNDTSLNLNSAGGSVLVTGAGSVFRQHDTGSDSLLTIQNGVNLDVTLGGELHADYLNIRDAAVSIGGAGSHLDATQGNATLPLYAHYVGRGGLGTLALFNDATGSLASMSPTTLHVGYDSGNGIVQVLSGADLTIQDLQLAVDSNSYGTFTVDGAGSTVTQLGASTTTLGGGLSGNMNIINGGSYTSGTGVTTLESSGTLWIDSGGVFNANGGLINNGGNLQHDDGTLNITGGAFTPGGSSYQIEGASLSDNPMLIIGAGASLGLSSSLIVGGNHDGQLRIEGGGAVTSSIGYIGPFMGSIGTATVTGVGSTWNTSTDLHVGWFGDGTLAIEAGGEVTGQHSYIGRHGDSSGSAYVSGAGSTWTHTGSLHVGHLGSGLLSVSGGGLVTSLEGVIGTDRDSTGTVTITGAGSSWAVTDSLDVGSTVYSSGGTGTLNIEYGGTVTSTWGQVGFFDDSTGVVTVRGTGSTWTTTSALSLGGNDSGNGTLNIMSGGTVVSSAGYIAAVMGNTIGAATVTGTGSAWNMTDSLSVGRSGDGTLDITSGGAVTNTTGYIGDRPTSTGTATIRGANSTWNNSSTLYVGNLGAGTLNIEFGGAVTNVDGRIGDQVGSTGTATITDAGSTWTNSGLLSVGEAGDGTLVVQNGAVVTADNSHIGGQTGSTGAATITGAGSALTISTDLAIGGNILNAGGVGQLNILDGGEVEVQGTLKIWDIGHVLLDGGILSINTTDTASIANLRFQAGTLNLNAGNLVIGPAGLLSDYLLIQDDQTVNVTNLATVEAGSALVAFGGFSSGGLTNNGTAIFSDTTVGGTVNTPAGSTVTLFGNVNFTDAVSGAGQFYGPGTANFNGGYTPGDSPAAVAFEGSASFGAGNTLTMEIGGLLAGTEFDLLDITGALTAGGTLEIALINAFVPSAGDVFDIFNFGSITGAFSNINLPALGGDLDWDTSNLLVDGTLSVFSTALQGDLDGDGFVGISDLNIVLGNWNQNVPPANPLADPSGDGFVGIDDLNTVLGNWNAGSPPNSTANIPEPTTLALITLGVMTLNNRRSR